MRSGRRAAEAILQAGVGFRVQGLGFAGSLVWGLGFRVQGLGP